MGIQSPEIAMIHLEMWDDGETKTHANLQSSNGDDPQPKFPGFGTKNYVGKLTAAETKDVVA